MLGARLILTLVGERRPSVLSMNFLLVLAVVQLSHRVALLDVLEDVEHFSGSILFLLLDLFEGLVGTTTRLLSRLVQKLRT